MAKYLGMQSQAIPNRNKPNVHMLRPGPIRDKARELAMEHFFMEMIDKGFDPYVIPDDKLKPAITVLLWNSGEHFFELAKEKLAKKGNGSSPD